MTASPTDQEAVGYEREIAHVLWETGFKVEIDNTQEEAQELPAGVEMTIKDGTIRPVHAYPIFRAFRSVGIAIATRINRKRRKNTTVYLTVGPKDAPAPVPPTSGTSKLR